MFSIRTLYLADSIYIYILWAALTSMGVRVFSIKGPRHPLAPQASHILASRLKDLK